MSGNEHVLFEIKGDLATVTLNRPDKHNAFDDLMRDEITRVFGILKENDKVRAVVLTGNGPSFCAGADLEWMRRVAGYSREQNIQDAEKLAEMFHAIAECPKPVIGRINGNALGGGAGFTSCCDIAIASRDALFAFPEVKLGIIPAVISPIVVGKIGPAAAMELFITGERIPAQRAYEIGLISQVVDGTGLDEAVHKKVKLVLSSGPEAVRESKELVRRLAASQDREIKGFTIQKIAELRATPEGREGMEAFLQKRKPSWIDQK